MATGLIAAVMLVFDGFFVAAGLALAWVRSIRAQGLAYAAGVQTG